ncbi:MAG: GNAT family N-acetyltransferase [Candidatus Levyibacteriota bacterium]
MESVSIRKVKENELHIIQSLNHQLFIHDEVYDPLLNMNWPFEHVGEEYFRNKISGKSGVCFVAEIDSKIVGYLVGGLMEPHSYRTITKQTELENILVTEECRGHGIGEKLFEVFIGWSKQHGAERIKVSTSAENDGAIKFYKKVGFIPYSAELEYELK